MFLTRILLVGLLFCSGCGPLDDEAETEPVGIYTISEDCKKVTCHGANDQSSFESGSHQSFTCVWHCVDYDGREDIYVDLTFVNENGCWVLDQRYLSSGICF
ncbi:MAG: hypothetical protein AMJ46_12450 [Latescibacteria bacterium DG_63]|nr:MAG: hypothetical protein AMJ46_12450 [Latescibacteria bacterium DG_63]